MVYTPLAESAASNRVVTKLSVENSTPDVVYKKRKGPYFGSCGNH